MVAEPRHGIGCGFSVGPSPVRQDHSCSINAFPTARFYDLLDTALSDELSVTPRLLQAQILAEKPPRLSWWWTRSRRRWGCWKKCTGCSRTRPTRFVLCGSSARALRRRARNLLGGRAVEHHLLPLTSREIPDLDLERYFHHGGLPVDYLTDDPGPHLKAYVNAYIREEIIDEAPQGGPATFRPSPVSCRLSP